MNEIIYVQDPLPNIASIKIYEPFKGEARSLIYPVMVNNTLTNIRMNENAMWADKAFVDKFSDEILDFVGNIINAKN